MNVVESLRVVKRLAEERVEIALGRKEDVDTSVMLHFIAVGTLIAQLEKGDKTDAKIESER